MSYKFGTRIQVKQHNLRRLQYDTAMAIWGRADPIVETSKTGRKAQAFGRKQYKELERLAYESV